MKIGSLSLASRASRTSRTWVGVAASLAIPCFLGACAATPTEDEATARDEAASLHLTHPDLSGAVFRAFLESLRADRHAWETRCKTTDFPTEFFVSKKTADCDPISGKGGSWIARDTFRGGHSMCTYHWSEGAFFSDRGALERAAQTELGRLGGSPVIYSDCKTTTRSACTATGQNRCVQLGGKAKTAAKVVIDADTMLPFPNLQMAGCPKCGMVVGEDLFVVFPPDWQTSPPTTIYAVGPAKAYVELKPGAEQVVLVSQDNVDLGAKLGLHDGDPVFLTQYPVMVHP